MKVVGCKGRKGWIKCLVVLLKNVWQESYHHFCYQENRDLFILDNRVGSLPIKAAMVVAEDRSWIQITFLKKRQKENCNPFLHLDYIPVLLMLVFLLVTTNNICSACRNNKSRIIHLFPFTILLCVYAIIIRAFLHHSGWCQYTKALQTLRSHFKNRLHTNYNIYDSNSK